jgi:hypothetical protein
MNSLFYRQASICQFKNESFTNEILLFQKHIAANFQHSYLRKLLFCNFGS